MSTLITYMIGPYSFLGDDGPISGFDDLLPLRDYLNLAHTETLSASLIHE